MFGHNPLWSMIIQVVVGQCIFTIDDGYDDPHHCWFISTVSHKNVNWFSFTTTTLQSSKSLQTNKSNEFDRAATLILFVRSAFWAPSIVFQSGYSLDSYCFYKTLLGKVLPPIGKKTKHILDSHFLFHWFSRKKDITINKTKKKSKSKY